MPCVELADSIVQTERETLEKVSRSMSIQGRGSDASVQAIKQIEMNPAWKAEVSIITPIALIVNDMC